MRLALLDAGVPPNVIFTDHAGFDTWTSMVRAKEVFNVEDAVVITQGFHMERALFLAGHAGLDDVTGYIADGRDYGRKGIEGATRELLGRVKAFGEAITSRDVTLGPEIPISGDGRESWGPNPPEGTPPAGAPRG
jgi:SanA protein